MKKYLWATALMILVKLYQIGSTPESSRPVLDNKTDWSYQLALRLGNSNPSTETLLFINSWQQAEGSEAVFNPLATTQEMPGATCFNQTPCVKNYLSAEDGFNATLLTLKGNHPGYSEIVRGIQSNDPNLAFNGLAASPWGTHAPLVAQIYNESITAQPRKSRVTDSMEIGASFNSVDCASWGFQAGCKHWGTDFICPENCVVGTPFDLQVIAVGYYESGPTEGQWIQGTFPDGFVFYAGHMKDRPDFQVGQVLSAGTPIGRTNHLNHTHVQLAESGNTGACAQNGTCVDFATYYNSH
jgi:murein DD-endopeptidase MepM/ murein hydrolase activator NlpD